jgi:hypothetical protein
MLSRQFAAKGSREADMQLSPIACHACTGRGAKVRNGFSYSCHFDVVSCQRGDIKTEGLIALLLKSRSTLIMLLASVPRSPLDMRGHGHQETGSGGLHAQGSWPAHWE